MSHFQSTADGAAILDTNLRGQGTRSAQGAARIRIGLRDGRVRPFDSRIHAARYFVGSRVWSGARRFACHRNPDRRRDRRHRLLGLLSDRIGRVRVLTWTIVLFAIFTGMCALAQGYWGSPDLPHYCRHRARRRIGHRHGAGRRSMAGVETCARVILCGIGMAARRARGGHCHAHPASGHRLARDVRNRNSTGDRRLFHPA